MSDLTRRCPECQRVFSITLTKSEALRVAVCNRLGGIPMRYVLPDRNGWIRKFAQSGLCPYCQIRAEKRNIAR